MRVIKFASGEYYHIFNRGIRKQEIFREKRDWARLLFSILTFQSPVIFDNISRDLKDFLPLIDRSVQHRVLNKKMSGVVKERAVELVAFCLMPNHFHLLVKQTGEKGVSQYLQRIQNSYTKFFNTKYKTSGHLFQGPFRAVHIEDNNQLLYTSAYIHLNPRENRHLKNKIEKYPWSSYSDYFSNRWSDLICPQIILEQFKSSDEYQTWTSTSGAKEIKNDRTPSVEQEGKFA